jgi:hypothetical protein
VSAEEPDHRKAVGQLITGAAVEPHAVAVLAGDDAEAVVLDLVQPAGPDGGHSQGDGRQGSIRRVRGNMGWGRCSVPYRYPATPIRRLLGRFRGLWREGFESCRMLPGMLPRREF